MFSYRQLALLFCLTAVFPLAAQSPRFSSHVLQQLAATLQSRYGIDCSRTGVVPLGENELVVTKDTLGRIDHIGFRLFPPQIAAENPSPVYRFVERYLLELYLCGELPTPARRLEEDKVTLLFPGHEREEVEHNIECHLPRIGGDKSLIVLTDNNRYSVAVYGGDKLLFAIRFPIRYELLWGINKKEAENGFYEALMRFVPSTPQVTGALSVDLVPLLRPTDKDSTCMALPGETYLIDRMNSTSYYRRSADGSYWPLWDEQHPEASVCNLFLLPSGKDIQAKVCQRLYGHRKLEFEVPLHKLLSFFRATGCHTYVGIETMSAGELTGTVVLLNPSYGYCHQLYFKMPCGLLSAPERYELELELYAYVPTHNIGNLFYERN